MKSNTTPAIEDPLNALRDIHLPEPVGFWPPAPGWWLLTLLVIAVAAGLFVYWRGRRARATQYDALTELERLETLYRQNGNAVQLVAEISILLRRCCLATYPRADVAGLVDLEWLRFLDRAHGYTHFTEGVGKILITAPYHSNEDINADALVLLTRSWLKRWPGPRLKLR